jgi:hypothetical protein
LFISKSIIEAHGCKIWAQNNADGNGATFAFSLPIVIICTCRLIFVGIYSSVISMSEDSKLRQVIRKVALNETTLLNSMSTAQMEYRRGR